MKKLLLSFVVLPGALAMAQVGVNTDQPRSSLDVAYIDPEAPEGAGRVNAKTPQGVNFPNVSTAQRSQFENVKKGMMIYNTDKQCLEMYLGDESGSHQWECIPNVGSESSQRVSVSPATFNGQFIGGVPLSNASVSFKITNNGFSALNNVGFSDAVTVENEGENITVNCSANCSLSLNGGESKTLTYTLSGTPRAGTLTARFNKLRLSADQQITVGKGNANLQNREHYIVSFAHGSTTIQGTIDNGSNQVRISIPYSGGKGSYDAVNIEKTTAPGQREVTKKITLRIPPGNFSARGELTATLEVEGNGSYPVKQMAPGQTYDIVTYDIDINGSTSRVIIKGIGGIPDRKFNQQTNGAYRHRFVYLPVTVKGANGYNKTWLNYNLGAEFARVGENFKPQQKLFGQAAHDEDKTHGSLYQWQRASDGHELRNVKTTRTQATNWRNAGSSAFITGNYNWVRNGENATGSDLLLWRAGGENNPCPVGYHVPTVEEWQALLNAVGGGNKMWTQKLLPNLAAAGYHYYGYGDGSLYNEGSYGYYWSSSAYDSYYAHLMYFFSGRSYTLDNRYRAYGFSVRCLKD